eukprot:15440627-Alexandrium_andersonii.AAC.1
MSTSPGAGSPAGTWAVPSVGAARAASLATVGAGANPRRLQEPELGVQQALPQGPASHLALTRKT